MIRVCKICGKEFEKKYKRTICSDECEIIASRERKKKWDLKNPEVVKNKHKRFRRNNLEKTKKSTLNWRLNNRENWLEMQRKWRRELPDKYVQQNMRCQGVLINDDTIKDYRFYIQSLRTIKQIKQYLKNEQAD